MTGSSFIARFASLPLFLGSHSQTQSPLVFRLPDLISHHLSYRLLVTCEGLPLCVLFFGDVTVCARVSCSL